MELDALLNILYSSEYVLHRFAKKLEMQLETLSGEGIDGLLNLFDSLYRLMESKDALFLPALNRNSVLGLYVRRMLIFFEKLPFNQVGALYNNLRKYIERKIESTEDADSSVSFKREDLDANK